jgi:hypothetical protein
MCGRDSEVKRRGRTWTKTVVIRSSWYEKPCWLVFLCFWFRFYALLRKFWGRGRGRALYRRAGVEVVEAKGVLSADGFVVMRAVMRCKMQESCWDFMLLFFWRFERLHFSAMLAITDCRSQRCRDLIIKGAEWRRKRGRSGGSLNFLHKEAQHAVVCSWIVSACSCVCKPSARRPFLCPRAALAADGRVWCSHRTVVEQEWKSRWPDAEDKLRWIWLKIAQFSVASSGFQV